MKRDDAEATALLWAALEDDLPGLKEAARRATPKGNYDQRMVRVVVGDYSNGCGEQDGGVSVDMATGRIIIAEVERIIRQRMVQLGQLAIEEAPTRSDN